MPPRPAPATKEPAGLPRLVVTRGRAIGRKFDLGLGITTIGSSESSDLHLADEGVGGTHATLRRDADGVSIHDGQSSDGTYVNGQRVDETALRWGDVIGVGRAWLELIDGATETPYHEMLYRLSTTDGLTRVFNRRYFLENLSREVARARPEQMPMCVLMVDLDHFGPCNQRNGERAGDAVLSALADRLRSEARELDVVARLGGDQLALLLPDTEPRQATQIGEALRQRVEDEPFSFEDRSIALTISVGVAWLEADDADGEALLQRAAAALRQAKALGRNRVACG